ncbi:MAG: hypothetical protein ACYDDA_14030 [Acidiferrobacteraceae bacterium]
MLEKNQISPGFAALVLWETVDELWVTGRKTAEFIVKFVVKAGMFRGRRIAEYGGALTLNFAVTVQLLRGTFFDFLKLHLLAVLFASAVASSLFDCTPEP